MTTKNVDVEFLYLDLDTCDRCQATDRNLATALEADPKTGKISGRGGDHEVRGAPRQQHLFPAGGSGVAARASAAMRALH
jgi:hypothetical protein